MKRKIIILCLFISFFFQKLEAKNILSFFLEFGGKGTTSGKFGKELYFAFDKENSIYIVDTQNTRIQQFSEYGKFLTEIKLEQFNFPKKIAIDKKGNIYVSDYQYFLTKDHKTAVYNYNICIHKISSQGKLIKTIFLKPFSSSFDLKEAKIVLDASKDFSLSVENDYKREIYFCVFGDENLYVWDTEKIYLIDGNGNVKQFFSSPYKKITSMVADDEGNIYFCVPEQHQIFKLSSTGKEIFCFGKKGYRNSDFFHPFYMSILADNKIAVIDKAEYIKEYDSYLSVKKDDPYFEKEDEIKKYKVLMRRIQIFDFQGKYQEKNLYKINLAEQYTKSLIFKSIDIKKNVYLLDTENLKIKKYVYKEKKKIKGINEGLKDIDKCIKFFCVKEKIEKKIDNWYDDDDKYDWELNDVVIDKIGISFKSNYIFTENVNLINETKFIYLNFRGLVINHSDQEIYFRYNYDAFEKVDYIVMLEKLGISIAIDQNPYKKKYMFFEILFGGSCENMYITGLENKVFLNSYNGSFFLWN
ncbi:MAG: NHL repeat-containing protein [bacterium]